jgi:hypothetical protein
MNNEQFDEFLDGALKRHANAPQDIEASRLPAVLLDWQFAPAWPRMAALGACAVLGFSIGISGIDRSIDHLDGQSVAASGSGIGSVVFEPEPLTGARP